MWSPAAIQFWPNPGVAVNWPPSQDLDDEHVGYFLDRFQRPIKYAVR
jgi:hypothetical protein